MNTRQHFRRQISHTSTAARRLRLQGFVSLLVVGAVLALLQPCLATPFTFDQTGSPSSGGNTLTVLQNGKVLLVGAPSQLYDPASGTWTPTGSLSRARGSSTATLLLNGDVLVTGGNSTSVLASCEIYNPSTGTWTAAGNLHTARYNHTATLLPDGRVLVAGGYNGSDYTGSAELFDPSTRLWSVTANLGDPRENHSATLLPNGKVLVAGGYNDDSFLGRNTLASCELYDPSKETWTRTGDLGSARQYHSATLLPNGKVLVAAGFRDGDALASAQLYDSSSGTWTAAGNLGTARHGHTATLLPDGKLLVTGGAPSNGNSTIFASAELYDSSSNTWTTTGSMAVERVSHSATLLPSGKVLVEGGASGAGCELFDPSDGAWTATAPAVVARALHTATILPNGQVLVAGGSNSGGTLGSVELYNPATAQWFTATSLNGPRKSHTATLLPNGTVLVAGGASTSALATAELYDRSTATWTNTGNLNTSRYEHTATLLSNGKVLVTGGTRAAGVPPTTTYIASAELYDPASGTWAFTGSMATARHNHTATLLPNGKVLVTGGSNANNNFLATCELYDPSTGAWTATGSMANPRELHSATLLPRQQVLVAGGTNDGNAQGVVLNSVEIYNPSTGAWVTVPSLGTARKGHSANLMPDGRVLVYGGVGDGNSYLTSAEQYDPATVKWTATADGAQRFRHTATLLPNGRVLAVGGYFAIGTPTLNASLYDAGFAFLRPTWQPQVSSAFNTANGNLLRFFVNGSRFQGLSEGSDGTTGNSATNYPVVQIRSIDNSQVVFLLPDPATGWSDNIFASTSVSGFPFGPAFATVFANGIPSDARYLVVDSSTPNPTPTPTATPLPTATPTPTPGPTATPGRLGNISTRLPVLGGDNILIAGMIATGNVSKKVIIVAIGPSLNDFGVPNALSDPTLEVFQGDTSMATNDDWRGSSQQAEIQASGLAPSKDAESAIIVSLAPGQAYTATVRGKNGETGVALVQVFDLDAAAASKLANISTRGFVGVDDNVMIAGVIISPSNGTDAKVLVRALGPTLGDFGVAGALANPTVELVNSSGTVLRSNDDWKSSQQAEIEAANLGPAHEQEAALIETIPPGLYTAVVRGNGRSTGAGLVEVYNIQ
jgi:N-acetylneuraminic acid mutarotase